MTLKHDCMDKHGLYEYWTNQLLQYLNNDVVCYTDGYRFRTLRDDGGVLCKPNLLNIQAHYNRYHINTVYYSRPIPFSTSLVHAL